MKFTEYIIVVFRPCSPEVTEPTCFTLLPATTLTGLCTVIIPFLSTLYILSGQNLCLSMTFIYEFMKTVLTSTLINVIAQAKLVSLGL